MREDSHYYYPNLGDTIMVYCHTDNRNRPTGHRFKLFGLGNGYHYVKNDYMCIIIPILLIESVKGNRRIHMYGLV